MVLDKRLQVRDWTKAEVDKFQKELILKIYYEFVYRQRDQTTWEVGMEVLNKIG